MLTLVSVLGTMHAFVAVDTSSDHLCWTSDRVSPFSLFGPFAEYDEFQKQSSAASQASVDFGSVESGQTSPIAVRKRSSAQRVERSGTGLDRIVEGHEARSGARSVSPTPTATSGRSKSPKSKSKRESGTRSPDRYPVNVVDPATGRLSKTRSSCDVVSQPPALSASYTDVTAIGRSRRQQASSYNSNGSFMDSSQYQPGTVASYVSSGPLEYGLAGSLGLIDRPLVLDGSPTSFAHNALLRGVPLSPNDISPRLDESGSLSASSAFSQSKPGSMSPDQRLPRGSRSSGPQARSGATGGASSSNSSNSGISATGIPSSPHSPHHYYPQQYSQGTSLNSHHSSSAQRLIDSKLAGPDHGQMGPLSAIYEPSASESERDATQVKRNGLGGVSPVLSSLLSPADEFLIQPVNTAMATHLNFADAVTSPKNARPGSLTSSSGGLASLSQSSLASSAGVQAAAGTVAGKRASYSTSHSRRDSDSHAIPATPGRSARGGADSDESPPYHLASPFNGGPGVPSGAAHTSPDIPRRARSLTSGAFGKAETNPDYLQGYPEGQQYAHLPQSDRPIPIITARSHSTVYNSPNTVVYDGGSTSPPNRRQQRRAGAYSAEGVLVSALHGTDDSSSNASSTGSSMAADDVRRGRTMSSHSGARSSRSTSPMAYMGEGRLLQNTAARTPVPELQDYFTIEDASVHFKLLEKLGKGSFGNVYIAKRRKDKSGKRYAIKKSLIDSRRRAQTICREIGNLRNSDHVNVVQFMGSYYHKDIAWIIMEYLDAGTLRDLRSCTLLKEAHIAYIVREILKGLDYMHREGTMHRDLKGENILLSSQGDVKIADLGLAVPAQEDQKRIAGSKYWMAPEMILAAGYGPKADLYSLGCTAYELADGLPPYAQHSAIRALFCAAKYGFPPLETPKAWSKEFHSFLATCTHPNPRDRPTCDVLLEHPFLQKACTKPEFAKLIINAFGSDYSGYVV